jgi:hypothetical protein
MRFTLLLGNCYVCEVIGDDFDGRPSVTSKYPRKWQPTMLLQAHSQDQDSKILRSRRN